MLHDLVGGYLEAVPFFTSVRWPRDSKTPQRCVAFCDEDGKQKGLPQNFLADELWVEALTSQGRLIMSDYLVGTVVVVIGDAELMENL